LKWLNSKRVLDLKCCQFSVAPVCFNEILPVPLEETRENPIVLEACVVKISEHSLGGGVRHRFFMLRCLPHLSFVLMAISARRTTHKRERRQTIVS
jgi:hypothetical protein